MIRLNASEKQTTTSINWPTLAILPVPLKILLTAVLITLALATFGALGQVIVHDIIPTFFSADGMSMKNIEIPLRVDPV